MAELIIFKALLWVAVFLFPALYAVIVKNAGGIEKFFSRNRASMQYHTAMTVTIYVVLAVCLSALALMLLP